MKFRDFWPDDKKQVFDYLGKLTAPLAYNRGCFWPNCNGVAIGAHVVPKNWMESIAVGGRVFEFHPSTWSYLSRDVIFVDTPRGRRPSQLDPRWWEPGATQQFPFLCEDHDRRFNRVDELPKTQDFSLRNLNWAVYRSVLAQQWRVGSKKCALRESGVLASALLDGSETHIYSQLDNALEGLDHYERNLRRCLEPDECNECDGSKCGFVSHAELQLKGKPKLAAATFSLGLRNLENWGLTVVPLLNGGGHNVIWHHFGEHQEITEGRISLQRKAQGRKREEVVSQCILRQADSLVFSPEWWEKIGEKRRKAIMEMVSAETGIATGPFEYVSWWRERADTPVLDLPNPRQLNLFRDV